MKSVSTAAFVSTLAILLAPAHAFGDAHAPGDVDVMEHAMVDYFRGERLGGVGFFTVGTGSVIAGALMVGSSSDFQRGMSYPLLGLGGAQALVGGIVMLSSGPRIRRFRTGLREQPLAYQADESRRMRGVRRTFKLLMLTEIVIAAGGLTMTVIGERSDRPTLSGVGVGLTSQAVLLLAQDFLASRRAHRYSHALGRFQVAMEPRTGAYGFAYRQDF